jgi:hypothetical protein
VLSGKISRDLQQPVGTAWGPTTRASYGRQSGACIHRDEQPGLNQAGDPCPDKIRRIGGLAKYLFDVVPMAA